MMVEADTRPAAYMQMNPVGPAAVTSTNTNCMYTAGYNYNTQLPTHSQNADRGGLHLENPSCIASSAGTLPMFETPSPSRHSSDGSSIDCCQSNISPSDNIMYNTGAVAQTAGPSGYAAANTTTYQLNRYWHEKVLINRMAVQQSVEEVAVIIQNILKQVQLDEPRFTCTLNKTVNGRYDGFFVESPTEFHILLYLNHMAVFNFIDEGNVPGCAALKLCDGRKRSMSLWVEFITASGYLSARKIRSKFHSLISQVMEKNKYSGVRLLDDANDVVILIKETFRVHLAPAFSWKGTWPSNIGNWVLEHQLSWPSAQLANEAMQEGITLVSKESIYMKDKQTSSEGDAWNIEFTEAEDRLLYSYNSVGRKRVLSILKCLRDRHLDRPGGINITNYHLKTLVLFEGEKHPCDSEWEEDSYKERVHSILLQLIASLQSHQCLHYLQSNVDLFRGLNRRSMGVTAKAAWGVIRLMSLNPQYCWDQL